MTFNFRSKFQIPNSKFYQGFTLIEVLLANAVLLITLVISLAIWYVAGINTQVNQTVVASHIATREMENIKATDFSLLPASSSFSDPDLAKLPASSAYLDVENYLSTSSIKQITVTVSWRQNRATSTFRLDGLVTSGGTNPP